MPSRLPPRIDGLQEAHTEDPCHRCALNAFEDAGGDRIPTLPLHSADPRSNNRLTDPIAGTTESETGSCLTRTLLSYENRNVT